MGTADAQSFYAGRRPNFMRIYNKIKEWFGQWLKLKPTVSDSTRYGGSSDVGRTASLWCPILSDL